MTSKNLEDALALYNQLESSWSSDDLTTVGQLLPQMKILLLNLSFLPTGRESPADAKELMLARNALEIGALWSIEVKNIPSFQRYVAQVKGYYFDYGTQLPDSTYKYHILGLNLLSLLAQNRLAEFHTEMELLSVEELKNIYIKHPISLEQFLMEGSFHKVFLSKGNVPAKNYNYFIDILINTIREEIASCAEKAYSRVSGSIFIVLYLKSLVLWLQISVGEAARMLLLDSPEQLAEFSAQRNWLRDATEQWFVFSQEVKKEDTHFIKNSLLISQELGYARELEKIV